MRVRGAVVVVAGCLALLAFPVKAEVGTRARVELAGGHDSNPLRISGDGPGALFADLDVEARLTADVGTAELMVGLEGTQRFHDRERSAADAERGELRLAAALPSLGLGGRRLDLVCGAFHELRRSTFTDRRTGEVYLAASLDDPEVGVPVGDRLNADTTGFFTDARFRLAQRLMVTFDGEWSDTRYEESHAATTTLDPLDATTLTLEPGLRYHVAGPVLIGGSLALTTVDYDSRQALDAQGEEIQGTTRRYELVQGRVVVQVAPGQRWRARVGLDRFDRADSHAGYFDSSASGLWIALDQRFGDRAELSIYGARRSSEYDNLTIDGAPDGEIRASDESRLRSRLSWRLNPHLQWFTETGIDRVDSTDVEYAHQRDWLRTGIAFEH